MASSKPINNAPTFASAIATNKGRDYSKRPRGSSIDSTSNGSNIISASASKPNREKKPKKDVIFYDGRQVDMTDFCFHEVMLQRIKDLPDISMYLCMICKKKVATIRCAPDRGFCPPCYKNAPADLKRAPCGLWIVDDPATASPATTGQLDPTTNGPTRKIVKEPTVPPFIEMASLSTPSSAFKIEPPCVPLPSSFYDEDNELRDTLHSGNNPIEHQQEIHLTDPQSPILVCDSDDLQERFGHVADEKKTDLMPEKEVVALFEFTKNIRNSTLTPSG